MFSEKLKILLIICSFVAVIFPSFLNGQWVREEVTTGLGWVQEAQIAEGRNDTINRIYLASPGSMAIYEVTWKGTTWDRIQVGSSLFQMRDVFVEEGRNDSVMRVYATDEGGTLHEYTWTGSNWSHNPIGEAVFGIFIAPGRNDGINRVYTTPNWVDNYILEHTWEGSAWSVDTIIGGTSWFYKPVLGNGRNDDTIRIYASCFDRYVYEFSWNGGSWDVIEVGNPGNTVVNDLVVGSGRNDGINRIYCAGSDAYMYEFSWEDSVWVETSSVQPLGANYLREIDVGDGRNDGVNRVYCAGNDSGLTELSWSGSNWQEVNMGYEIDGLTVGDGRGDGIIRVYADASISSVFAEYSYGTGITEIPVSKRDKLSLRISPNPFTKKVIIRLIGNQGQMTEGGIQIPLEIFDISGRIVNSFPLATAYPIFHISVTWDGTNKNGEELPCGIYFIKVSAGETILSKKLLFVR